MSGTSTWLADTTTDSETALMLSVMVPTSSDGDCSSTLSEAARKPSIETRRLTRPRGGASITNSPRPSVRTVASGPSPVAITRAPATARPAASTTRPRRGPAARAPGAEMIRTNRTSRLASRERTEGRDMGLLLGVSRADGKGTARLQVSWLADCRVHPSLPIRLRGASLRFGATVAAGSPARGWRSPLTVAAPRGIPTHFAWPPGSVSSGRVYQARNAS